MGTAYTGEDANYIESPYSHKSFTDFYDNIMSIKNSLYGGVNLSTPNSASAMSFMQSANPSLAAAMSSALEGALSALKACQVGPAFVEDPTATKVKVAMDAINALDDQLQAGATWAATVR